MPKPVYLFVYGTLCPGHAPALIAPHVDRCRRVGAGHIAGRLYDLRRYPGAVVDAGGEHRVYGQLLLVPDDDTLAKLDWYERYDPAEPLASLFVRTECDVTLEEPVPETAADDDVAEGDIENPAGGTVRAFVYVYNRDTSAARLVPGGQYHPARPCETNPTDLDPSSA